MKPMVLVISEDEHLLQFFKKILTSNHYQLASATNFHQVESLLNSTIFHCILLDVLMLDAGDSELLNHIIRNYRSSPVILISGESGIHSALEAVKNGAYDFIKKPIDPDRLLVVVRNAIQKQHLQKEKDSIYRAVQDNFQMIGHSAAIGEIIDQVHNIAGTNAKVLVMGESGTGKELVAWAIHHNSRRAGHPYIKINCAALPSHLLESELFGHKRGSFTGAVTDQKGKFSAADGGTLFLDEVGDMDLHLQAKLLRVLDEGVIEVIGDTYPRRVDVRVIAATNKNLEAMIYHGKFRIDLYHRLNVAKIRIPPLRERQEDIVPLARHFLKKFNEEYNKQVISIHPQAQALLTNYNWPGNVRELRNIMEKMIIFSEKEEIGVDQVVNALEAHPDQTGELPVQIRPLRDVQQDFEKKYILMTLNKFHWKIGETANALGIDRSNLFRKMRKLGIRKKMLAG